jgi:hypothetical protein
MVEVTATSAPAGAKGGSGHDISGRGSAADSRGVQRRFLIGAGLESLEPGTIDLSDEFFLVERRVVNLKTQCVHMVPRFRVGPLKTVITQRAHDVPAVGASGRGV